jgi:hypothetical protein
MVEYVRCQSCFGSMPSYSLHCPFCGRRAPRPQGLMQCLVCDGKVSVSAAACPHCGHPPTGGPPGGRGGTRANGTGAALLLIPFVALVGFGWFGSAANAAALLVLFGVVTAGVVFVTATLAAVDADELQMEPGPVVTFILVTLMWALFYPIHMYRRSQFGAANLLVGAALLAFAFCAFTVVGVRAMADEIAASVAATDAVTGPSTGDHAGDPASLKLGTFKPSTSPGGGCIVRAEVQSPPVRPLLLTFFARDADGEILDSSAAFGAFPRGHIIEARFGVACAQIRNVRWQAE